MRHNQNRRSRGRGRKAPNPLARSYESNGPDVKVRGNAAHVAEKYTALARDALASGDTVAAEAYFQHAEHYNRIVAAAQAQYQQSQPLMQPSGPDDADDDYAAAPNGESHMQPERANGGGGAHTVVEESPDKEGVDKEGADRERRSRRAPRQERSSGDQGTAESASAAEPDTAAGNGRGQRPQAGREEAGDDAPSAESGEESATRDGASALAAFPD